jgi:hypothetical protein
MGSDNSKSINVEVEQPIQQDIMSRGRSLPIDQHQKDITRFLMKVKEAKDKGKSRILCNFLDENGNQKELMRPLQRLINLMKTSGLEFTYLIDHQIQLVTDYLDIKEDLDQDNIYFICAISSRYHIIPQHNFRYTGCSVMSNSNQSFKLYIGHY